MKKLIPPLLLMFTSLFGCIGQIDVTGESGSGGYSTVGSGTGGGVDQTGTAGAIGQSGTGGVVGQAGTGGRAGQPGSGGRTGAGTGGAPVTQSDGLPCDVRTLMMNRCWSCHGTVPSGGAPMSLVTYADLTAPGRSNPAMTAAQLSLSRMQNTAAPMPPAPAARATTAEIATMQSWSNMGFPMGSCGATDGGTDSGTKPDSGTDSGTKPDSGTVGDPLNASPICTSNKMWSGGNSGSSSMNPGLACINCHSSNGAPRFTISGTVYPTGHEPDRCNGFSGAAQIVITGADGKSTTLTPNTAGNFYSTATIAKPFQAKVVYQGRERAMGGAQTSGDCNSCHTQSGTMSAPGRIVLP